MICDVFAAFEGPPKGARLLRQSEDIVSAIREGDVSGASDGILEAAR